MEARLASDDETIATLRKQIEKAERDLEKKDKLFHELESKLAELESGNRHRALLQEIHAKDERLEALGQQINAMTEESQTSDAERSQLAQHLQAEREQRDELRSQLADLETETPRPQTPNGDAVPRIENRLSMLQAHSSLQDRYDQTLAELESLNTKYKQSLQRIQQLNQQLDDNQLEEIDNSSGSPASSLNGGSKPPRSQRNSLLGDSDRTSLLLNSGQHSPNQSRRSMPIGVVSPTVRGSTFLAKAGVRHSSSQSHLRSASLSREPVSRPYNQ